RLTLYTGASGSSFGAPVQGEYAHETGVSTSLEVYAQSIGILSSGAATPIHSSAIRGIISSSLKATSRPVRISRSSTYPLYPSRSDASVVSNAGSDLRLASDRYNRHPKRVLWTNSASPDNLLFELPSNTQSGFRNRLLIS